MALFMIPLYERFTDLNGPPKLCGKSKCLVTNGFGVRVYYENEKDLVPENIQRFLIGRRRRRCYIDAKNLEEAKKSFYENWEGAKIGGEKPENKALYINAEEPIVELPSCKKQGINKRGDFICGDLIPEEDSGEWGMCILEGYDPPYDCPIDNFYRSK